MWKYVFINSSIKRPTLHFNNALLGNKVRFSSSAVTTFVVFLQSLPLYHRITATVNPVTASK